VRRSAHRVAVASGPPCGRPGRIHACAFTQSPSSLARYACRTGRDHLIAGRDYRTPNQQLRRLAHATCVRSELTCAPPTFHERDHGIPSLPAGEDRESRSGD
jgi:hypothetical protein